MSNDNVEDSNISAEDDLYYFETDHLALRGNKDYSDVLKNLLILCAQRKQAIKDYNTAVELKKEALADPSKVLEKIIKGESLGMPDLHQIPELPTIDWTKYDVKIPEESLKLIYSDATDTPKKTHESPKREPKTNQKRWTTEEQKRLEELLQVYPPEPVEMRRFKKIADALGNRTIQQVTSRVQKYFLKLYKAGLPIPGRIPKSAEKYRKTSLHKHQRHNHYLWRPTTFFPDLCVPVVMNELESAPGPSTKMSEEIPKQSSNSNYLMPSGYLEETNFLPRKSEPEMQLELLKRIRKVKTKDEEDSTNTYSHIGFKCNYCEEEPIVGTRWHCSTCTTQSFDFCTDCVLTQSYSDNCHPLHHYLLTYSDKEVSYLSDSESGSGAASLNKNNESSESSDSEFNNEDDEEMTESIAQFQDQVSNGVADETIPSDNQMSDENFSSFPKLDFGNFNDNGELYDTELGSDLFSEIDNISYDYLHSSLLLDKE